MKVILQTKPSSTFTFILHKLQPSYENRSINNGRWAINIFKKTPIRYQHDVHLVDQWVELYLLNWYSTFVNWQNRQRIIHLHNFNWLMRWINYEKVTPNIKTRHVTNLYALIEKRLRIFSYLFNIEYLFEWKNMNRMLRKHLASISDNDNGLMWSLEFFIWLIST